MDYDSAAQLHFWSRTLKAMSQVAFIYFMMHAKWDNCLWFLTREVARSPAEIGDARIDTGDDIMIDTEGSPLTVEDA